jgi:hypothetical protein
MDGTENEWRVNTKVPKTIWRFIERKEIILLNSGFGHQRDTRSTLALSFSMMIRNRRLFAESCLALFEARLKEGTISTTQSINAFFVQIAAIAAAMMTRCLRKVLL